MHIAYLILVHKNPHQVGRLVSRLPTKDTDVYIHIDKKIDDISEYTTQFKDLNNVFLINKRVNIMWGAYSMVQATLNGLSEIINSGQHYDYINLLSGQDYPIKSNEYIFDFFERNNGQNFIQYGKFPVDELSGGGMDRVYYYYNFDNPKGNKYELEMKIRGKRRSFINDMEPYHGSQWWSLTGECVQHILDKVRENKELTNFYRYSMFSDEQFFKL